LLLYVVDAAQAYLQSHDISRIIFTRLPKELRCRLQGWLFRILKPVYGIMESGAYWFDRYIKLWYSIELISSVIDICLMFRHRNGHLDGATALMADDTLLCGSDLFRREEQDMHQSAKIKLGKRPTLDEGPLRFGGTHIRRRTNGLQADQTEYVSSLADKALRPSELPDLTMVKSAAGALGWLATQTRCDVACAVSLMNQSEAGFEVAKLVNSTIDHVLKN
jgi:hypothetical protein